MLPLEKEINAIIQQLGILIMYVPQLDGLGQYIASLNAIVLDSRLEERERLLVLLHELGHASKHAGNCVLYNRTFALHSKMENEADEFMITKLIEAKVNEPDFEPSSFSITDFLDSYEIDYSYECFVKKFIVKYFGFDNQSALFFRTKKRTYIRKGAV